MSFIIYVYSSTYLALLNNFGSNAARGAECGKLPIAWWQGGKVDPIGSNRAASQSGINKKSNRHPGGGGHAHAWYFRPGRFRMAAGINLNSN